MYFWNLGVKGLDKNGLRTPVICCLFDVSITDRDRNMSRK